MNNNRCVACGAIIPEGRQVCPQCESAAEKKQIDKVAKICCSICDSDYNGACMRGWELGKCYIAQDVAQRLVRETKQEVAREIFEEFEKCFDKRFGDWMFIRWKYAELKKKYIGDTQ